MSPRPTMVDVARSADVSLKTVSRFVNGATNIDPVLGERISAAIRALGYTRNMAAASLRPGRSGRIVGLVIEDLGNPSYPALTRSVEAEVRAAGYLLLSASSEESGAMFDRWYAAGRATLRRPHRGPSSGSRAAIAHRCRRSATGRP
jgi:LacI family transcriptional regulator